MHHPDLTDPTYRKRISDVIRAAIESGACTLDEISANCRGAGVDVVRQILEEEGYTPARRLELAESGRQRAALARRRTGEVLSHMPAPDPERAQWWFTLDAIERLAELLNALEPRHPVVFLGTPSLAVYYATRYEQSAVILDVDKHVLAAAQARCDLPTELRSRSEIPKIVVQEYNVKDDVPPLGPCDVLVMDPPWYDLEIRYFSSRARDILCDHGKLVTTYPGELTRKDLANERQRLREEVLQGFTQLSLMPALVSYRIPHFEDVVFADINEFSGKPWRFADVLLFELGEKASAPRAPLPAWNEPEVEVFAKNPRELRLFFAPSRATAAAPEEIESVPLYSSTVSRRGIAAQRGTIALWSSTKRGFRIRNAAEVRQALELWERSTTEESALTSIPSEPQLRSIVQHLFQTLDLPADTRDIRTTDRSQLERHNENLAEWATRPLPRQQEEESDGFRLPHARDRDRIVWSDGLKRLANKTQVFSLDVSDNVRQRLAHSIEVMQLASTIGASFRLDRDLIEAGALAHDIGHTPFGHAGEYALDATMNAIAESMGGFNHYEHGVDVVRWLETPYRSPSAGRTWGLNLTRAIAECIFKHTYCMGGDVLSQTEIWRRSKYKDNWSELAGDKPCHLEGQAVRIADKISYLVSDLEDGFRLGVFSLSDLRTCRLFDHAPLDYRRVFDESDLDRFIAQRRVLLAFLMEDVIGATAKRLSRGRWRESREYTVDHSLAVKEEVAEVWKRLQSGMLHRDGRVIAANMRAARIISDLLVLFALQPSLVEPSFARMHRALAGTPYMIWYCARGTRKSGPDGEVCTVRVGNPLTAHLRLESAIGVSRDHGLPRAGTDVTGWDVRVEDLVMGKDYVASLSDARARRLHREFIGSRSDG